jgi:two-component system chemotaxis response regulator CheY
MRILAVEDEPEYLEMLEDVMNAVGHTITIATDGFQGIEKLKEEKIDVIMSDVKMPNMDGIEFHKHVRAMKEYTNTPFIFLTGVKELDSIQSACKADCDLILQKPFPVDKLLEMFTGQLGKK